jgi:prephenate dehydrogenase
MIDQTIAIIGGTGQFGQHMGEHLEDGNEIVISGTAVEKAEKVAEKHGWDYGTSEEIVEDADIVVISVPIDVTVDVIHNIGSKIPEDALLCDVTSVKQEPVEAMKNYSNEVLGMHPMYAPSNSIKGQKVALCPEKGDKWTIMEEFWEENGAHINVTDPETHDKAMSIVQGLIHFSELVIADVIRKSDNAADEMEDYSTPIYQLVTDLTARMLNQKPELYGSIQSNNPENEVVRNKFVESAEELKQTVKDKEKFADKFKELGKEFDLETSQKRTDELIEFLSNDLRE